VGKQNSIVPTYAECQIKRPQINSGACIFLRSS
jgi:hypothetical protein